MMRRRSVFRKYLISAAFLAAPLLPSQAFAACTSPTGNTGDIIYSSSQNTMFYCSASSWVSMGSSAGGIISSGTWNGSAIGVGYGGTGGTAQTTNGVNYYNGSAITSGSGFVYSGGNVGFGTTSPSTRVSIHSASEGEEQLLRLWNNAGTMYYMGIKNVADGQMFYLGGNSGDVLGVTAAGSVGIGTTGPGQKLEVNGNIYLDTYGDQLMSLTGNNYGRLMGLFGSDGVDHFYMSGNYTPTDYNAGTVGNALLGTAEIELDTAGSNTGTINFKTGITNTAPSSRLTILSSGSVGIGTTAPLSVLESVAGDNTRAVQR